MRKKFNKYKYVALSSMILMPISGVVNAVDTATNEETKVENLEAPSIDTNEKTDLQEVVDNTQKVLPEAKSTAVAEKAYTVPAPTTDTDYNWGGLKVTLDTEGTLHVPAGTMTDPGYIHNLMGAVEYRDWVKKVVFEGPVKIIGNAYGMFWNPMSSGSQLTAIEGLGQVDTSETTNMGYMFAYCNSLEEVDLSNFDTSKATTMIFMFAYCSSLKQIDVTGFDTSKVTTMWGMFDGCSSISKLDISNFTMPIKIPGSNSEIYSMLDQCTSLKELKLGNKLDLNQWNEEYGYYYNALLPNVPETDVYTGYWQNVGSGTVDNPKGSNVWTSLELMRNDFKTSGADTYVWQKKAVPVAADVTVKYVDEAGNKIAADSAVSGKYGDTFAVDPISITGYTFKEAKNGVSSGSFTDQPQTITFIYKKNPVAADVTVKYVDEAGNKIAADSTISGKHGDTFAVDPIAITGYTFKEAKDGISSGSFTDQPQTITFIYKKNPIIKGDVTIKHVDSEGNLIADNINLNDEVGKAFTLPEPQKVKGYSFKEVVKTSTEPVLAKLSANTLAATTGIFTSAPQEYSFVYTKDPVEVAKETPNIKKDTVISKTTTIVKNKESKLPQTDDNRNLSAVLSILGLGIIAGIGFRKFVFKEVK